MVAREFSNFKPPSSSDNNDQNQSMNWIGIDVSKNVRRYRKREFDYLIQYFDFDFVDGRKGERK